MSPIHLFFTIVGLLILAATLPLSIEFLLLSTAAAVPPRPLKTRTTSNFRLAVIIPAHNEERLIATCVTSLLADRETPHEVFVIAHNCTDRTADYATQAGARVLTLTGPGGKGLALDYGFRHALELGADAVLVIDADSVVSKNLLAAVAGALRTGADAVQTRYQVANADANYRTRLAALSLLGMNVLRPRGRARLSLSCGIFGNGFALSANTLARVPYTANSLVEDLEYHLRLVSAGIAVQFLDHATVYGEMPEYAAASATQRARWEGGRTHMRRQWTIPLLKGVLSARRRLVEPLLDLLSLTTAIQTLLLVVAILIPLLWLRVYGVLSLLVVFLYVLVSASLSADPFDTLKAVAVAPGYILWKLLLLPQKRLAARKDAAWIRTGRNADTPPTQND